jgi:AraC-like DNA-binding protein
VRPPAIPQRKLSYLAASQSGTVVLGRVENEDRLWRGTKDRYAIIVPRQGCSEYLYRGGTYQQGPGRLRLLQPGEFYRDLRHHGLQTFDAVVMEIDEVDAARAALGRARGVPLDRPDIEASDPRAAALLTLHAHLTGAAAAGGLAEDCAVAEAASALTLLGASTSAPPAGRERSAVRRARAYLLERLAERVRLDELADHVGLDKYHLIRAFRAEVGVPPYEFLTHARIQRARELLNRGVSVTRAAATLGYYDQSQMHRHFLRLVGLPPGRYAATRTRPPKTPPAPRCFGTRD